ncbi:hypothetical protein [Rugamonas aquatica]|uniref:hypothetical protein n=1 Tax=Rugamonas aquatica TaxID=2743357 RepID=UPI002E2749C1
MHPSSHQYVPHQWVAPNAAMAYGKFLFATNSAQDQIIVGNNDNKPVRQHFAFAHPSLRDEKRTHVGTACAAYWLGRKQQTLRSWACFEDGPIRPIRINGRLAWSVDAIRRLMGVEGIQ